MATIRLQMVLARAGVASRRAAEAMIAAGRVRVDGRVVTEMGTKVEARDSRVEVDGTRIVREQPVYVLLHKPRGVVSTMYDPEGRPCVKELLADVHARVFPVGRLDFNTSGVLFATNDGEFSEALLHPRCAVPKTYVVKVQGVMSPPDVDRWRSGVELEDGKTKPAKVKLLRHEGDKTWLELTITEGRNQQVRRMGDATLFRVMRLARTSFAGITSEALAPGRWRYLTLDELKELKKEYGVPKRVAAPPAVAPSVSRAETQAPSTTDTHGRQVRGPRRGPSPEGRERPPREDRPVRPQADSPRGAPRGRSGADRPVRPQADSPRGAPRGRSGADRPFRPQAEGSRGAPRGRPREDRARRPQADSPRGRSGADRPLRPQAEGSRGAPRGRSGEGRPRRPQGESPRGAPRDAPRGRSGDDRPRRPQADSPQGAPRGRPGEGRPRRPDAGPPRGRPGDKGPRRPVAPKGRRPR